MGKKLYVGNLSFNTTEDRFYRGTEWTREELAGQRARVRQGIATARRSLESPQTSEEQKAKFKAQFVDLVCQRLLINFKIGDEGLPGRRQYQRRDPRRTDRAELDHADVVVTAFVSSTPMSHDLGLVLDAVDRTWGY